MAYCSKCGAKVSLKAEFCSSCGANLAEFEPEDTFEQKGISIPKVEIPKITKPDLSVPKFSLPAINWKPIAIGVAILALIGVVGITAYQFVGPSSTDEGRETPTALTLTMTPELDDFPHELGYFSEGIFLISNGLSRDERRLGYANRTGEIIVEPQYDYATQFSNGVALVGTFRRSAGKGSATFRFLTADGSNIGTTQFTMVRPYFEGLAAVQVDQKWGYVDQAGKVVINPQYDTAGPFSEGIAVVGQNGRGVKAIDSSGKTLFEIGDSSTGRFSEGLLRISRGEKGDEYIDTAGKRVIDFQAINELRDGNISASGEFSDDRAVVKQFSETRDFMDNSPCGYIGKTGKIEIAINYNRCGDFRGGLAAVGNTKDLITDTGDWQFIDVNGNNVFGRNFSSIEGHLVDEEDIFVLHPDKRDDHWIVTDQNGLKGVVSLDGNLIAPQYERIHSMTHGLFAVKTDAGWSVVNSKGEFLLDPQFSQIGVFQDGKAWVKLDKKWGYLSD